MAQENEKNAPAGPTAPDDADRRHCDEMLDEALEETFPASDPPAVTVPPGKDC